MQQSAEPWLILRHRSIEGLTQGQRLRTLSSCCSMTPAFLSSGVLGQISIHRTSTRWHATASHSPTFMSPRCARPLGLRSSPDDLNMRLGCGAYRTGRQASHTSLATSLNVQQRFKKCFAYTGTQHSVQVNGTSHRRVTSRLQAPLINGRSVEASIASMAFSREKPTSSTQNSFETTRRCPHHVAQRRGTTSRRTLLTTCLRWLTTSRVFGLTGRFLHTFHSVPPMLLIKHRPTTCRSIEGGTTRVGM